MNDPIDRVVWLQADTLVANNYNPNRVFSPELKLLELSIFENGWIQPVLVNRDLIIIDGFHRWMLSTNSKKLVAKYAGAVPCVILDVDRAEAMMMTIRINRAKGTHVAVKMADVVHELVNDLNVSTAVIAEKIGATRDEVDLLYQDNIFKARNLDKVAYSKAWYPVEIPGGKKADDELV